MSRVQTRPGTCRVCGEPMPPGEEVFYYHGYSGPCPKPPLPKQYSYDEECEVLARHFLSDLSREDLSRDLAQTIQDKVEEWIDREITRRAPGAA